MVEHLPSICKAFGSIPNSAKIIIIIIIKKPTKQVLTRKGKFNT